MASRERRAYLHKRYMERKAAGYKYTGFSIVKDKLAVEEGGFNKGKRFNLEEHRYMLLFCSYTPGTIIKDCHGKRYEIIEVDGFQKKVPVGATR
jgi:hypothetical protein